MRPWIRLDDLDDQLDQRGRREELAAALAFGHGELAQEVLVDLAEGIAFDVHRNLGQQLEQSEKRVVAQSIVVPGQNALHALVVFLDGLHRGIDGLADVRTLGLLE